MSYQLILILVLFVLLANIIWPSIVSNAIFNNKVIEYMKANNITSPHCYTRYMAKVSKTFLGIDIDIGIDNNGYFLDCNIIPDNYYRCSPVDYVNVTHPCSFIKSYFRFFAL